MKVSATFTTILAVLVTSATAAPYPDVSVRTLQPRLFSSSTGVSASVPDPTVDDFYQPPAGFERNANGAVLRSRNMTTYRIENSAGAFQILYKTINAEGDPDTSVVTLVIPRAPVSPARLVSLTRPEDSAAPICAPSYQIRKGTGNGTGLEAYLAKGYWGLVPDHEGSKSATFVGPTEGPAILDAIRAAITFQKLDVKTTQIGLTGYSGGAHAAAWGAQLSKTYAPELNIVAAAVGGVPVSPKHLLLDLTKTIFAGLSLAGVVGQYNAYSDLRAYFDKHLTPKGRKIFDQVRTTICFERDLRALLSVAYVDILYLVDDKHPLDEPIISNRLAQNFLGGDGSISQVPTYIYHGRDDDIVSRPDVDAYVKQQCAGGARFKYVVDAGEGHITEEYKRAADAQNWIIGRLNGSIPVPVAC